MGDLATLSPVSLLWTIPVKKLMNSAVPLLESFKSRESAMDQPQYHARRNGEALTTVNPDAAGIDVGQ